MRSAHLLKLGLALFAAGVCAMLLAPLPPVSAQDGQSPNAEQAASISYGSSITFTIQGSSSDTVSDALLHIHILNRADSDVRPQTMAGGTSFSASATVPVTALQLPPFAQITYNWEVKYASGSIAQAATQVVLYEDTSLPWAWKVENRDNVFVHWDGQDPTLAEITLASAARASDKLADLTGTRPTAAIHIYVYPELSDLAGSLRRSQQRVQDWVAAYSVPDQGGVFIAASAAEDMLPNLNRDLAHELTHLSVYSATSQNPSGVPGWLNEGLALSSADEADTSLKSELDKAVHDGVLLSLGDLCVPSYSALPPHDAALAYAQSESFARYIIDRYGVSQTRGLLAAYAGGSSCSDGVRLVLGVPLDDVESQWHAELGRSYGGQTSDEISLLPWLIAWCISLVVAFLFISPQPPAVEERPAFLTRRAVPPVSDIK